jgi:signal transduction histidine kinase/CheY-like chemotaxis protein
MLLLKKEHYIFLILISIFGFSLAFVTYISFKDFEQEKISTTLKEKADDRIVTFQHLIDDSIDEIISLRAFFNASEKVERLEFHAFCQSILEHQPGLQALEWIPLVTDAERRLHEESARQDGFPDYRVTEREKQGLMIPAHKRDEYFPVYYIEPLEGNELALGYDLGSNPVRLEAIELSRDSGKVVATSRVTLVQDLEEQYAFLVFLPVYKSGQPVHSVKARRKALNGFVLGVFRVGELLSDAMSVLSPQGIDVYIYEESENNPGDLFLGFYASRLRTGPIKLNPGKKDAIKGYYYTSGVNVADRTWKVYFVPTPEFISQFRSWQVWGVPGVIFLFVVFVITCLAIFLDREENIKQHARDLTQAKDVLENEILERKRSEQEKANLETQLRHAQKLESIGTLAGGIAHDFNNILTIIAGNTELAKLSVPEDSPAHKKLSKVISASKRAKDLVSQILSFSRKVDQDLLPVRPHIIMKETINMLRSTIPATIEIQEDIDTECGTIVVDPTQIDQILINLCTNAVHAMQEKGTLGVGLKETFLSDRDLLHRPDMVPGKYAELSVSDTGTGIDPETIDRVFDPFFTTKEVGKGTGMGLSMVHGIALSNRGMIMVDSEPGMGSQFHVYFPVVESEDVELEEIQEDLPTGTEKILLVDDEEGIVDLQKNMLEQHGYTITTKTSSIEALDYVTGCPEEIDLVITDQSMPEMSGTELIAEIKKIRPDIPVILTTGFSTKVSSEEEAKAMGITEFIMKPVDMRSLVTVVRKALDQRPEKVT